MVGDLAAPAACSVRPSGAGGRGADLSADPDLAAPPPGRCPRMGVAMSAATGETIAFLLAMGVNVVSIAFGVRRAYRHLVAERIALQAADILRSLCVQAYMTQHRPIWQAWADGMGSIKVRA